MQYTNSIFGALFILSSQVFAIDVTRNPSLDSALTTQATQLDRLNLLGSNSDWLFDFSAQSTYSWAPGSVVNANAATFPAAVENELTMAMINLAPCAMLPPHYHPRASNYVVSILGNTTTYMIEENGAEMITEVLTPMKMTIFPRGSLHAMQNTGEFFLFRLFQLLGFCEICANVTCFQVAQTHNWCLLSATQIKAPTT